MNNEQVEIDKDNILAKMIEGEQGQGQAEDNNKGGMPGVNDIIEFFRNDPKARAQLKADIMKELKISGWAKSIFENYFDTFFGKTETISKKSKYRSLDEHLEVEDFWELAEMAFNHRKAGHTLNWIADFMDINPKKVSELISAFGEREAEKDKGINKIIKTLKIWKK